MYRTSAAAALLLGACSVPPGAPALGDGAGVELRPIASSADGLVIPRDLAFHPTADEMWVVNYGRNSMTIFTAPGTEAQTAKTRSSFGSRHFLAQPSALAFGDNGFLATAQEQDERTQSGSPGDFMGPTLWPADSHEFDGGHGSHHDMLHNSPNGVGIAHEQGNAYWIVDGYHASLTRYDFNEHHGPGGADHSDGLVERYVEGQIAYLEGVSSHADFDPGTALLYVADAGNGRIVALDTESGSMGDRLFPNYDGTAQYAVEGARLVTLVDDLDTPSGLVLHDGLLYVSDNATSEILAYDLSGRLVDAVAFDLPAGSLQGLAFAPDGTLHVVDTLGERIFAVEP